MAERPPINTRKMTNREDAKIAKVKEEETTEYTESTEGGEKAEGLFSLGVLGVFSGSKHFLYSLRTSRLRG
jgi:hypothetical protein